MNEQLKTRLEELQQEYKQGQMMMAGIRAEQDRLMNEAQQLSGNILRILGAIQVLEELLADENTDQQNEQIIDANDQMD